MDKLSARRAVQNMDDEDRIETLAAFREWAEDMAPELPSPVDAFLAGAAWRGQADNDERSYG